MPLCNLCADRLRDVFSRTINLDTLRRRATGAPQIPVIGFIQTVQQLDECIRLGCHVCLNFFGRLPRAGQLALQQGGRLNPETPISGSWGYINPSGEATLVIYLSLPKPEPGFSRHALLSESPEFIRQAPGARHNSIGPKGEGLISFIALPARDVERVLVVPPGQGFGDNSGSDLSMLQIRDWLSICTTSHPQCKKPRARQGQFPSRLLRIYVESGTCIVRLEDTSQIDPSEQYVALSHCWGKAKMPVRLEIDTKDQLQAGIAVSELPSTFRDAISAVQSLGQRYLWIDTLCIIQNLPADWEREGMQMDTIYDNAWCTLAASHAHDSTEGLFTARDPRLPLLCSYDLPVDLRKDTENYRDSGHVYLVVNNLWQNNIDSAPLNSRAWVVQERLLSPRIVHFGADQVFWECSELAACEGFPAGLPYQPSSLGPPETHRDFNAFKRLLTPFPRLEVPNPGAFAPDGWRERMAGYVKRILHSKLKLGGDMEDGKPPESFTYETWWKIVAYYTQCNLSHEQDKLVAISGIAKRLQPYLNDVPCAGLWRKHLIHGLTWSSEMGANMSRPEVTHAPSWSWASVKGPIRWDSPAEWYPAIEVVRCDTPTKDGTGFGEVKDYHLTLRGRLQPVQWSDGWVWRRSASGRGHERASVRYPVIGDTEFPFTDITWDITGQREHVDVFIVPLGWWGVIDEHEGASTVGLLLKKHPQSPSDHSSWYTRVGVLHVWRMQNGHGNSGMKFASLFRADDCLFEVR